MIEVAPTEERDTYRIKPAVTDIIHNGRLEQVFIMLLRAPTMDLLYAGEGDRIGGDGESEKAAPSP